MFKSIEELFELYAKILEGTATKQERSEFEITVKTSCMDETFLMNSLQKQYEELKSR